VLTRPGIRVAAARNHGASDGMRFLRHGGRAAAPLENGFGEFGDFSLRVKRDVTRNFAQRAGEEAQSSGDFGDAIAMRVPGMDGRERRNSVGQGFGDFRTAAAKCGKGANGAAELQRQDARLDFGEPLAVARNCVEPSSNDEAEGGGQGLLHPRASDNKSGTMFFGERDESAAQTSQVLIDEIARAAHLQNATGVDGILAGGAPVNEARRVLVPVRDKFGEFLDEGMARFPAKAASLAMAERSKFSARHLPAMIVLGIAGRFRRWPRRGKSGFKIEHALNAGSSEKSLSSAA